MVEHARREQRRRECAERRNEDEEHQRDRAPAGSTVGRVATSDRKRHAGEQREQQRIAIPAQPEVRRHRGGAAIGDHGAAYPATRESANKIAIKTTAAAVAKASRLANKRRIAAPF